MTPQCSRSVIGLIDWLTQALTLSMSVQALDVSTMSRGSEALVAHSGLYSIQKSTHPIGARVGSPTVTKTGRSSDCGVPPSEAVNSPAAAIPSGAAKTATPARASMLASRYACLKRLAIAAPSRLVGATFPTNPLYWG